MARPYFRARGAALFLLLALGACATAGDGDGGAGSGPGESTAGPSTTTGATGGDRGGNGSPTTTARDEGPQPGGDPARPTTTTTRSGSAATTPGQPGDDGAKGSVGSYSRTLLRGDGEVVLDVLAQQGASLRRSTTTHLVEVLTRESGKPVAIATSGRVDDQRQSWTAGSIAAAADEAGTSARTSTRAVIKVLVLRGSFADQPSAIGVAVRGDTVAIFIDQVERAATPLVSPSAIEDAVTIHELGHVLGLVDLVVDRNRDDPEHPSHSRNRESVMYWAIESDLVAQVLGGPPGNDFDAEDRSDLAAIRAGA